VNVQIDHTAQDDISPVRPSDCHLVLTIIIIIGRLSKTAPPLSPKKFSVSSQVISGCGLWMIIANYKSI
jgi:hypothetical protein